MEIIYKLNQIQEPVLYLRKILESKPIEFPVILLKGEMGAGKTTFTSHFVKSYNDQLNPNSPTFNLMNEYRTRSLSIFHFDLYRLKSAEDIENLGFEEIWGKQGISIVEWWEVAENYFDSSAIKIELELISEETRKFTIQGSRLSLSNFE